MRRLINWIYIYRFVLSVEASCQDYSILHLDTASVPDNEMTLVCIYYLHPGVLKPAIFGSLPWAYVKYNLAQILKCWRHYYDILFCVGRPSKH